MSSGSAHNAINVIYEHCRNVRSNSGNRQVKHARVHNRIGVFSIRYEVCIFYQLKVAAIEPCETLRASPRVFIFFFLD